MRDISQPPAVPLRPLSFDGPLGRQIVELHMWVVREGIRGAAAAALFDGLCQRFVIAGVPLWRAFNAAVTKSRASRRCVSRWGNKVLISAELAAVVGDRRRLEPLGYHALRGVRDPRQIYGLDLAFKA